MSLSFFLTRSTRFFTGAGFFALAGDGLYPLDLTTAVCGLFFLAGLVLLDSLEGGEAKFFVVDFFGDVKLALSIGRFIIS